MPRSLNGLIVAATVSSFAVPAAHVPQHARRHPLELLQSRSGVTVELALEEVRRRLSALQASSGNEHLVYTVITAQYDEPSSLPANCTSTKIDYVLLTDDPSLKANGWNVVAVPGISDPQLLSRDLKMRPHLHMPGYKQSLYLDANLAMVAPLQELFALLDAADLAVYSFSRGLREEAAWLKDFVVSNSWLSAGEAQVQIEGQVKRYLADFPNLVDSFPGTFYGKVILRRHNELVGSFNDLWFKEFSAGVHRDQLSFRYCALSCGLTVQVIPRDCHACPVYLDPSFTKFFRHLGSKEHKKRQGTARPLAWTAAAS